MKHPRDRLPFLLYGPAALVLAEPARAAGGLEIVPDLPLLVALLIAFVVLVYPVDALLFRPIFRVLDARNEKIGGTRSRAERLSGEAEAAVARYESALAEARQEVGQESAQRLEEARREGATRTSGAREGAETEVEAARGEMQRALEEARAALRTDAESLARDAAARLLGRSL